MVAWICYVPGPVPAESSMVLWTSLYHLKYRGQACRGSVGYLQAKADVRAMVLQCLRKQEMWVQKIYLHCLQRAWMDKLLLLEWGKRKVKCRVSFARLQFHFCMFCKKTGTAWQSNGKMRLALHLAWHTTPELWLPSHEALASTQPSSPGSGWPKVHSSHRCRAPAS